MADEIKLELDTGRSEAEVRDVVDGLVELSRATEQAAESYALLEPSAARAARSLGEQAPAARQAAEGYELLEDRLRRVAAATAEAARADAAVHAERKAAALKSEEKALDALVSKRHLEALEARATAQVLRELDAERARGTAGAQSAAAAVTRQASGMSGLSRAAVQASYGLQDFVTVMAMGGGLDRAMLSMANNITPLVMALGGSGGLAAGLGLLATTVPPLVPLFHEFWASFTGADGGLEKFELEVDEAAARLKKLRSEWERLKNAPTKKEAGTKTAVESAITEHGAKAVQGQIAESLGLSPMGAQFTEAEKEAMRDTPAKRNAYVEAQMAAIEKMGGAVTPEMVARFQGEAAGRAAEAFRAANRRRVEENREAAKRLLAEAPTDKSARKRIATLAAEQGGIDEGFLRDLAGAEPEARGLKKAREEVEKRIAKDTKDRNARDENESKRNAAKAGAERSFREEMEDAWRAAQTHDALLAKQKRERERGRFFGQGGGAAALKQGDRALWARDAARYAAEIESGGLSQSGEAHARRSIANYRRKLGPDFEAMVHDVLQNQRLMTGNMRALQGQQERQARAVMRGQQEIHQRAEGLATGGWAF